MKYSAVLLDLEHLMQVVVPADFDDADLDWLLNRARQLCDRLSKEVSRRQYPGTGYTPDSTEEK